MTLAQWQHIVSLNEAMNVLHQAMCIKLYCPGSLVIKIAIRFDAFHCIVDNRVAINEFFTLFVKNNLAQLLQPCPQIAPCQHFPCAGSKVTSKFALLMGEEACHDGDV